MEVCETGSGDDQAAARGRDRRRVKLSPHRPYQLKLDAVAQLTQELDGMLEV